jgi:hypothetical protein
MKQVPSSNFSQGEEVTEVPDVRTSRKSAPFRVGSLRGGGPIRPITGRLSLPPTSFTLCSVPLPCGRATTEVGSIGLTQLSIEKNPDRFGWSLYPGGNVWMSSSSSEEGRSDPLTFWSRPVSPFGRFVVTRLERLFTYVQPSDPSLVRLRIQGWQGPDRCPRSFGRRITPSPVRVGTPGHHRVRGGIATSFTTLLDRPCGRMHNVYVRPLVALGLLRGLRRHRARAP